MDWRLGPDTVIDAEVEWSRRSQPSQPGFSLLGATLPAPVDPRTNLNNQPWSQPVVFGGVTGSVRLEQALGSQWRWTAQAGTQRLQTDDRVAFPFGPNYAADHTSYAPNGDYDLYDYRSEGERRTLGALRLAVHGKVDTGSLRHDIGFGVLRSTTRERYNRQEVRATPRGLKHGQRARCPQRTPPWPPPQTAASTPAPTNCCAKCATAWRSSP